MPEIIDEGVTGYLVDGIATAVERVDAASALDRSAIRAVTERRFGASRMVDDYLAVYRRVLEHGSAV
jgi:glycosyltransferase involved in cell wall biosynthesis